MDRIHKVIVTHAGALQRKHGRAGVRAIELAVARMVRSDKRRGIATRLIAVDRAADMKPFGKRVTVAKDPRQVKRAIDDIHRAVKPDYVMILGAPDVIPHQRLKNPISARRDENRWIESDLPYACEAPHSTIIKNFLGPTRVVGRLPDVMKRGDTKHFVHVIDSASSSKSRPRANYRTVFALSAAAWKASTRTTARSVFGSSAGVRLSPHEGPVWTKSDLRGRVHLINCHGDTGAPAFYGENEDDAYDQPIAHEAAAIRGRVPAGTVVAAECCYGAELYEPIAGDALAICQTYLNEGACAFFGSTTISYGPAEGSNFADILCGRFLRAVLSGASVGRAALMARQQYIAIGGYMEMVDLKTIAQFLLLGDPSLQPVATGRARAAGGKSVRRPASAAVRRARRKRFAEKGSKLAATTAWVSSSPDARPGEPVKEKLRELARDRGARAAKIASFKLHSPRERVHAPVGRKLVAQRTVFHAVVLEEKGAAKKKTASRGHRRKTRVPPERLLIVREVDGMIRRVVEAFRH